MVDKTDIAPFAYKVKVGHISANPVTVTLKANDAERAGLARIWEVDSVESLEADLHIARWKKDGVRIKGEVRADITQSCVVTLEPVKSHIRESIEQVFVPEGSKLARHMLNEDGEMILDPEGADLPETFSGDSIDAGVLVCEFVALAIDPYPRKQGVVFEPRVEADGSDDKEPSPFAVLKDWKKD